MRVLAGDIGGTKTLLALYEIDGERSVELRQQRYESRAASGLSPIVAEFLGDQRVDAAAFAIAGPVQQGTVRTTNLPWVVEQAGLVAELGSPVALLNDFAAVVLGIGELADDDLISLHAGERDSEGPIAVLGAGTGLGEGYGVPTARGMRAFGTEGGHTHFAPRDEFEQRLLSFLRVRVGGRVSVERVVSGPGLLALYEFVIADGLHPEHPDTALRMKQQDPSAVIAELGDGQDPACTLALTRFLSIYGAEAGDLALKLLPSGGLYVAGGIAPKLLSHLRAGGFIEAYLDKGRMSEVLRRIPVAVVNNPQAGLLGARARACMIA